MDNDEKGQSLQYQIGHEDLAGSRRKIKQCRLTLNCELTVGRFLEDFFVPAVGADGFICSTMS